MNNIFKAIVIDDEKMRNDTYTEVLSNNFCVNIVNEIYDINRNYVMEHNLLVIDICLSKNVNTLTAFKIMDDYNITLPTVIISSEWLDEQGEPNDYILEVPKYKNIIKVISWNEFNTGNNNAKISEEIFYEFCKYNNFAMGQRRDIFRILQISDLQFGGNLSGIAFNDVNRIGEFLENQKMLPDLLVVTGDIADKGKRNEYQEALSWLENLIKRIWKISGNIEQSVRDRVIVVPGNHDYDLSISAADNFDFIFGSDKKNAFSKIDNKKVVFENQKLGFYNFSRFAYKLTGNIEWLDSMERLIYINEKFINCGIRFLLLNSAYSINSLNCENRHDGFYCDLSEIDDANFDFKPDPYNDIYNILIMHNPPSDFKKGTSAGERSWNRFQTIIEDNKIRLCLYGHTHDIAMAYKLGDNGGKYCRKLKCISAPSARLAAASRTEDADRGFNIIEICPKTSNMEVKVHNYVMKKAEISEVEFED